MSHFFSRQDQRGFSLVESLIGMAIMAGMGAAAYALLSDFQKKQQQQLNATGLLGARSEIERFLSSEEQYARLTKDAKENAASPNKGSLMCILNKSDCRSTAGGPLRLMYDYSATSPKPMLVVADPSNPTQGLTSSGAPCNTFNRVSGDDKCPYRYEVRWRPVCPADLTKACTSPSLELVATLEFRPPATPTELSKKIPPIDRAKYRVAYLRAEKNDSVSETCLSVDGVYSSSTGNCYTNLSNQCGAEQFVVGFDDNGRPRCGSIKNFQCKAGTVLVSLTETGDYKCAPGCIANTTYTNTWYQSSN